MEPCSLAHSRDLPLNIDRRSLQVSLVGGRDGAPASRRRDKPIGLPGRRRQQVLLISRKKILEGTLALVQRLDLAVAALQHLIHRQVHEVVGRPIELGLVLGVTATTAVLLFIG